MAKQGALFHPRVTVSRIASGGVPRRASSRRSCKMRAIASARLLLASSCVLPCPFATGISGQYAINHSSSCSMIAVNSLGIAHLHNDLDGLINNRGRGNSSHSLAPDTRTLSPDGRGLGEGDGGKERADTQVRPYENPRPSRERILFVCHARLAEAIPLLQE